jgi:predicted Zn finger-like uncharacterized protein
MILTCPECATGYFVDDGLIKATGRTVRCAACSHRWTAYPGAAGGPPLELTTSEEGAIGKEPAPEAVEAAPLTGDDLPRVFRDRAEEGRKNRRAALNGVIWMGAALGVLALVALAVVFREVVVKAWPPTASLYAGIGLPVNVVGLVVEQPHVGATLQDGHPALAVSCVIRNVTDHVVIAPPLRISVFNGEGKRVAGQITALANNRIPAGETRTFQTFILDPGISAANINTAVLQIEFATDLPANAVRTTATPTNTTPSGPPAFTLRGADNATEPAAANATNAASNATAPPAANAIAMPPAPASAPPAAANAAASHR